MPLYDPRETPIGHLNNALMTCQELLRLDDATLADLHARARSVPEWVTDVAAVRDRIVAALEAMTREPPRTPDPRR